MPPLRGSGGATPSTADLRTATQGEPAMIDSADNPGLAPASKSLFENLVEEITNKLQAGEAIDCDGYAQRYPELAERLRLICPMLLGLATLQHSGEEAPDPASRSAPGEAGLGVLGDFRLI